MSCRLCFYFHPPSAGRTAEGGLLDDNRPDQVMPLSTGRANLNKDSVATQICSASRGLFRGFLVFCLSSTLYSQEVIDITGRLVGEMGLPLANCTVSLPPSSMTMNTAENGAFNFKGVTSLSKSGLNKDFNPTFSKGRFSFTLHSPDVVLGIDVYDVKGVLIHSFPKKAYPQGVTQINLEPLFKNQTAPALNLLNINRGGENFTYKLFVHEQRVIPAKLSDAADISALKKSGAKPQADYLQVACGTHPVRRIPIQSANMGDITIARPNIVLILTDDLGYSDIGSYGGEIETPQLDKLASEGIRFRQFYNMGICFTTRTNLLSGVDWHTAGMGIDRGITFGQAMKAAGYSTLMVGKWHVDGTPQARGFDRVFSYKTGAPNSLRVRSEDGFHVDGKPYTQPNGDWYLTDVHTDFAVKFMQEEKAKAPHKPMFLYLAFNAPHNPLVALPEDVAKYRGKYLKKGWDVLREERFQRQLDLGLFTRSQVTLSPRTGNIPAWNTLSPSQQDNEDHVMAVYAGMVDRVDQNIGRLKAKLEELKMLDNTLILFLSDNGADPFSARGGQLNTANSNWQRGAAMANASNSPFRLYKRNVHQGGISTPFIAWWPRVIHRKGEIVDHPGHVNDVMPSLIELANWKYPDSFNGKSLPKLDGMSLVPLFEGKPLPRPDGLYFHFADHMAVISDGWKLVRAYGQPFELYHLETDLAETRNLIKTEPAKAEALTRKWNAFASERKVKSSNAGPLPGYVKF